MIKALFFLLFSLSPAVTLAQDFSLGLEAGAVWQHRNDVRISPDQGTYLEFNDFDEGPFFHYRIEGFYNLSERHFLRALYAPFNISVKGVPATNVVFDGVTFAGGNELTVNYRFNSYRVGYFYRWFEFSDGFFDIGVTAKWRDAKIELEQPGISRAYTNGGLVPLLYIAFEKMLFSDISFNFSLDGSASSQGRAFDGALKLRKPVGERLNLGLGVRSLEGGADNDKVFTFSWFNYAVIDLVWEL